MIIIKQYKTSLILFLLLIIISIFSLFIGAFDISISGLFKDPQQLQIFLQSRIPRLLAILCTGVGMSIAGLIMQNLCRNKFVSPSTGATISGAQLGILLCIILLPTANLLSKTIFAFTLSLVLTWLFIFFINKIKFKDVVMVPLIGIMFSSVIGAVVTFLSYKFDLTQAISSTMQGSFSLIIAGRYEIVFLTIPMVILAFIYANHFNIAGMGENFATNLGINYKVVLFLGLTLAALITSSVVVTVGTISYIGLVVPNIVSMYKGDKIKGTILDIGLFGALFVLICDIIGRVVIAPYELPIDLICGVIGSVVFLILLVKKLSTDKVKKNKKVGDINEVK